MNKITETLQMDHLIMEALREDISSEDVTTNSVMKEAVEGEVELICRCLNGFFSCWMGRRRRSFSARTEMW